MQIISHDHDMIGEEREGEEWFAGAALSDFCRGWEEMGDSLRPGGRPVLIR